MTTPVAGADPLDIRCRGQSSSCFFTGMALYA
jgi:hypothetical protein